MTSRTAEDAYRERLASIQENLKTIALAVDGLALKAGACLDWGNVGDLVRLEEILSEARKFISNEEE